MPVEKEAEKTHVVVHNAVGKWGKGELIGVEDMEKPKDRHFQRLIDLDAVRPATRADREAAAKITETFADKLEGAERLFKGELPEVPAPVVDTGADPAEGEPAVDPAEGEVE